MTQLWSAWQSLIVAMMHASLFIRPLTQVTHSCETCAFGSVHAGDCMPFIMQTAAQGAFASQMQFWMSEVIRTVLPCGLPVSQQPKQVS